MKLYIGTKIIAAEPMSEHTFKNPINSASDIDRPGYKVVYEDGYVSWSPKETFEHAYREISDSEMRMIVKGA